MPRYMYHWTPRVNLRSIMRTGLDPAYATGKRRVVWMGAGKRLMWACAHAALHQRCGLDDMTCIRIRVDGLRLGGTAWRGVKTSATIIPPSRLTVMKVRLSVA